MASFAFLKSAIYDREERKQHYQAHIKGLNAYERHKKFLNDYVKYYGKEKPCGERLPVKTDQDALKEGYRFIRTEEDDMDASWEQRLVKRYYDKLFKDYEVNFSYFEAGENKQALVKLVACERCAEKLHYKRNRQKEQMESKEKAEHKRKREVRGGNYETDDEYKNTNYDLRHKSEIAEWGEKEHSKMQRERSVNDQTNDEELDRSKERKQQGKRSSSSRADNEHEDAEHFDEYLEGMFP